MPRQKLPPPLSEGQLEVMEIVWASGEVSVNDVWHALREKRPIARNTVQTILLRLDEKGWLTHRRQGKQFLYAASHPREAAQRQWVRRVVDVVFDGSAEGLMLTLLEGEVAPEQLSRIRTLIDDAEKAHQEQRP